MATGLEPLASLGDYRGGATLMGGLIVILCPQPILSQRTCSTAAFILDVAEYSCRTCVLDSSVPIHER